MSGSVKRRAVFLRIAMPTGDFLRLWLGFGDILAPINDLDVGAETYQGLGILVGIPALEDAINGKSSRADFSLSGLPAEIAALADADAESIQNATVNVGVCKMDDDWQLDGDVIWVWDGLADVLTIGMSTNPDGSQSYTLQLSAGTANVGRSRAEYANWTDAQHQKAHPGDLFFNNVPPPEATKRWPGG